MSQHNDNNDRPAPAPEAGVPVGAYIGHIARRTAWRLWWVGVGAAGFIAAGFAADIRLAIVGFMILLLIFPMAMTIAVLGRATHPRIVALTRATSAEVTPQAVTLKDSEGGTVAEIPPSQSRGYSIDGGSVVLRTGGSAADIVIIPCRWLDAAAMAELSATYARRDTID